VFFKATTFLKGIRRQKAASIEFRYSDDTRVEQSFAPCRPTRRIGLISPGAGNLGNAAIMTAMIDNIRKRITGAEILGITTNPAYILNQHGIPAIPLSGISQRYYSVAPLSSSETPSSQKGNHNRIKILLKKIPLLFNALRAIWYSTFMNELTHIVTAARALRKLDMIIVCGGGALDEYWGGPWGHPWTLCKWGLLCRLFGVPFLFVSVGKCSLERPLSRFYARVALYVAEYRSYRDYESRKAVHSLLDTRCDPVYPDLAFSYSCEPRWTSNKSKKGDGRLVVGVSPIAYLDPRSWPRKDERRYATYIGTMAEIIQWLLNQDYKVFCFATDGPDVSSIDDILDKIAGSRGSGNEIETLPPPWELSPDEVLMGICSADLIIASRLHGVILSHLSATPALALSYDPKVDAHMKEIGQMDYCLNVESLTLDMLIERFLMLKDFRQREEDHLRSKIDRFRRLLDLQYDRIFVSA
jgi:polysaccharide pyruvyl transferase WcaK-like protein